MAEDAIIRTMLFDYYGDFLTEKQKEYYDLHYNEDLSLFEISEETGVSRQAVWDNIKRAEASLNNAESKLGLVDKQLRREEKKAEISERLKGLRDFLPDDKKPELDYVLKMLRESIE